MWQTHIPLPSFETRAAGALLRRRANSSLPRTSLGALLGRFVGAAEIVRGIDQRDVRESLRKIADLPLLVDVIFFRQQSKVVAEREQPLE